MALNRLPSQQPVVLFSGFCGKPKQPPLEVGVYLGSFNPIHNGHLLLAQQAKQQFNLDAVEIVALAKPSHKKADFMSDAHRQHINTLAVVGKNGLVASSLDIDAKSPTLEQMLKKHKDEGTAKVKLVLKRTLNLLKAVRKKYETATGRSVHLNYIVGIDGLAAYPHVWKEKEYAQFIKQCRLLIAPRPKSGSIRETVDKLKAIYPKLQHGILKIIPTPLASSDIRRDMQSGKDVTAEAVPQPVADYLNQNRAQLLPPKTDSSKVA